MNIWIVNHYAIPPSFGGLVRHFYFSKYLQKKGHNVRIITSSKIHNTDVNMIKDRSLYKEKQIDGIEYTFVKSRDYSGNGMDRIFNMIDFPFKVNKALGEFYAKDKPDVIYTSSPDLFVAFIALLFGKRYHIPVVVEIRDLWPESIVAYGRMRKRNPIIGVLYQLEKMIYKKADRLIFTMEGGKDYIREKHWDKDIDMGKIYHVNNGVDIEEFDADKHEHSIDDADLNNQDNFKVVYTGSIRSANGVESIVYIANLIKKKKKDKIQFLIYGEGNERKDLVQLCEKLKLDNIIFKGKVEKKYIPYILSKGQLNFMHGKTTHIMHFGCSMNKLFDYMASGVPILSDLSPRYDLIKRYDLGVVVEDSSPETIANTIIDVYENYGKFFANTKENMQKAKKKYDYCALTDEVEKILSF